MWPLSDIFVRASLSATIRCLGGRAPFAELVGYLERVEACSKRLHFLVALG